MILMKRGGRGLAGPGGLAVITAGRRGLAQTPDMRLLRDPVYGELRDVLGATLPVATPNPKCPKALAQLPDGACLDGVVAGMKARGATSGRVLTAPGAEGGAGAVISGPLGQAYRLYEVTLSGGGPIVTPVTLPTSRCGSRATATRSAAASTTGSTCATANWRRGRSRR
jgi:hypothetical protein